MTTSTQSLPPVTKHPTYFQVLLDPIARNYVVTIIAAVLGLFVVQLLQASMIASLATTALAAIVLLLNKRSLTLVMIPLVAYFQAFPLGVPSIASFESDLSDSHFRIMDLALVGVTLVYVFAQLRFFSLAAVAVPEGVGGTPPTLADRRSPNLMTENELTQLFMSITALVVIGQMIWVIVAEVKLQFDTRPLVTIREPAKPDTQQKPRYPTDAQSRLIVLGLMLGVPTIAGSLLIWLWRWRGISRDEATMFLIDLGWQEMRREAARQETWRAAAVAKPPEAEEAKPKPKARPKPSDPSFNKLVLRWVLLSVVAAFIALAIVCGLLLFVLRG